MTIADMTDRHVAVLGASTGIGLATARLLADRAPNSPSAAATEGDWARPSSSLAVELGLLWSTLKTSALFAGSSSRPDRSAI